MASDENELAIKNLKDAGFSAASLYQDPNPNSKGIKGQFKKGNPGGMKGVKASRSKMTQLMLDRVAARSEAGLSAEEILIDIMQDPDVSPDLRFKAAAKVADIVFPKAASVEMEVDNSQMSIEEIDQKIAQLLQANN